MQYKSGPEMGPDFFAAVSSLPRRTTAYATVNRGACFWENTSEHIGKISIFACLRPPGPTYRIDTMKLSAYISYVVTAALLFVSCGGSTTAVETRPAVTATILPLKYLVEQIAGQDFAVEVLVPTGASPETFEPTPKQYIRLNESQMVFATGLIDFENALLARMDNKDRLVDLSRGIELMAGSCSHDHHAAHKIAASRQAAAEGMPHGIDPHIWTSPRELRTMARNTYEAIMLRYPDSVKYTASYEALDARLRDLDSLCSQMCRTSSAPGFRRLSPRPHILRTGLRARADRRRERRQGALGTRVGSGNRPCARGACHGHALPVAVPALGGRGRGTRHRCGMPRD